MKNILRNLLLAVTAVTLAVSCETYKVDEPGMTAVSDIDGNWVCFGVDEAGDSTVFYLEITNNTYNDPSKVWVTVTDMNTATYPYLDGVRFLANVDGLNFSCKDAETLAPQFVWNPYQERKYYSYEWYLSRQANSHVGKATIEGGKVTLNAVPTGGNMKASAIELIYTRSDDGEESQTWKISGMKNTGWYEDLAEYVDFMNEYF